MLLHRNVLALPLCCFLMSATPIFDLEQAAPKAASRWRATLIALFIGLAIGALFILADQNKLPAWHWPRFNARWMIPGLYLAIAVHELGHWAAGSLVGLSAGGISVGAFVFVKSGKNWAFHFNRQAWIGGFFRPLTADPDFVSFRQACLRERSMK